MDRWFLNINDEAASGNNDITEYKSESEALGAAEALWGKLTQKDKKALIDFKVYKLTYDDNGSCKETIRDYLSTSIYDDDVYQRSYLELQRIKELLNYLSITIISDDAECDINQPSVSEYDLKYEFKNDWITINKARNGKDYVWYYDGNKNAVIDIESGEITDDDKFIDDQFC